MSDMPWRFLRAFSQRALGKKAELSVHGLEYLPARGPAIIAARHFHHEHDGEALLAIIPRPAHPVVAIDWATQRWVRTLLIRACQWARWPMVVRKASPFATAQPDRERQNYRALRDAVSLLQEGRVLVIFPEGFPTIDNNPTPKRTEDEFLPFEPGFVKIAQLAARRGATAPIIPVGFHYERGERWAITMRFGSAIEIRDRDTAEIIAEAERAVRNLSAPPPDPTA